MPLSVRIDTATRNARRRFTLTMAQLTLIAHPSTPDLPITPTNHPSPVLVPYKAPGRWANQVTDARRLLTPASKQRAHTWLAMALLAPPASGPGNGLAFLVSPAPGSWTRALAHEPRTSCTPRQPIQNAWEFPHASTNRRWHTSFPCVCLLRRPGPRIS